MCHFHPVHHFGIACLAGSKVNIQNLGKGNMKPFVYLNIMFCLYTVLHNQRSISSNYLIFQIQKAFRQDLRHSVLFSFLFARSFYLFVDLFFNTVSSSSSVNCPSLMSSWHYLFSSTVSSSSSVNCPSFTSSWQLLIFWEVYRWFQERFQADFRNTFLNSEVFLLGQNLLGLVSMCFFFLLTPFTVCHNMDDCLSSTKFLILSILSDFID